MRLRNSLKRYLQPSYLIFLLIFFHLIGNLVWLQLNSTPPPWDEAAHTRGSLSYYHIFTELLSGRFQPEYILVTITDPYGPLLKILAGLFMLILYPDIRIAQFIGTLFFVASIYLVYRIGVDEYKNIKIGLVAAFLYSFFAGVVNQSHYLSLDIGLSFFICLFYFALTKLTAEKTLRNKVLLALIVALATLTKIQALFYIPILCAVYLLLQTSGTRKKIFYFLGSSYFLGIIFTLPWIVVSLHSLSIYYANASIAETGDPISLFSPLTWAYYTIELVKWTLNDLVFFFILPAILIVRKVNKPTSLFFLFSLFTYIILTLFPNKDIRYMYPTLPFIAVLLAYFLVQLVSKSRFFGFAILFIVSVLIAFGYSQSFFSFPNKIAWYNQFNSSKYPFEQMVFDLRKELNGRFQQIIFLPDYQYINGNSFEMYLKLYNVQNAQMVNIISLSPENLEQELQKYSYFYIPLTNTEEVVRSEETGKRNLISDYAMGLTKMGKAAVIGIYQLPMENTVIQLVKRI